MGLVRPCSVSTAPKNTGHDCQVKMSAPRMIIMVPRSATWTSTNELTFLTYLQARIVDTPANRWFPLFGNTAPMRTIDDSSEADVIVTYDDGSQSFIRNGTMTRTFMTDLGGMEQAKAFKSFNQFSGQYAFIEIDGNGHVLRKLNTDGTYSGVPCAMAYSPTPKLAGLKTDFLTAFSINFTAEDYIENGNIATSEEELLDLVGLVNLTLTAAAAGTTTILKVYVKTTNAQVNLDALYPTQLPLAGNFIITKVSDSSVITPSAVVIESHYVKITGTFVSGQSYNVVLAAASVLAANGVDGYEMDADGDVTIAIP